MSPILVVCLLICCGYIGNIEAGKGKVPIYMPIPIPVPMLMSPSEMSRHPPQHIQQHQNRQYPVQQRQEDEGEVKKIYLLQPISRPNSPVKQPSFHPAQTQIHPNPPPLVQSPRFQIQSPQYEGAYAGGGGGSYPAAGQEEYQSQQTGGVKQLTAHNMHSNDMKILPIVVIPPIAPMQPIQLHPPGQQSSQRVSVESQINNYVSTVEPPYLSKTHRNPEQLYDFKTFSDYGGSGGGALFRENLAPRRLHHRPPRVLMQAYKRAGSRIRPRYIDQFHEDYDYASPPLLRHHRVYNHYNPQRAMMQSRMHHRRRLQFPPEQPHLRMSARAGGAHDSIRDIIDQQVHFDDDENENRNHAKLMENLTADNTDPKDSIALLDDAISSDSISSKKPIKQTSRFDQKQDASSQLGAPSREYPSSTTAKQASDLTYYEHDLPQSNSEFDSHKEAALLQSNSRIYSEERDALEDDEWWFDTMKSVSHTSPTSSNHTTSITTNNNSTSTTTLAPSKS